MEWPLTGRDSVLRRLAAALSRDGVRGIEIVGEAGVGKTRMAAELMREAAATGRAAEMVEASAALKPIPYAVIAHLLPQTDGAASPDFDPAGLPERWRADADGRPLLLVVDDAPNLDEPSAAFLSIAAEKRAIALVLTRRRSDRLPPPLAALWRRDGFERAELSSLDEDTCTGLLTAALGGPVDRLSASKLWRRSKGNPLFLRELVTASVESGALVAGPSGWRLAGPLAPSSRLIELVEAQIGGLDPRERDAAEILAVGGTLGISLVEHVAGHAAVERLEERHLVELVRSGNRQALRLAHPLYAEALLAAMPRTRVRRRMHALADHMEALGARRRDDLMRLAVWGLEGGRATEPNRLLEAARQALAGFDATLAERLSRAAISGQSPNLDAHLVLGEALAARERIEQADAELKRAAALAQADDQVARVAIARANLLFYRAGKSVDAARVLSRASARLSDDDWRAEVDSLLTLFRAQLGDLIGVARSGGRLAARPNSRPRAVVHALAYSSIANVMLGRLTDAHEQVRIGERLAPQVREELPMAGPMLAFNEALALSYEGNLPAAMAAANQGHRAALAAGFVEEATIWGMIVAECEMLSGDIHSALQSGQNALVMARERDPLSVRGICAGVAAVCAAWLGRADVARELRDEVAEVVPMADVRSQIWLDRASVWVAWLDEGPTQAAARALDAGKRAITHTHLVWAAQLFYDAARLGMAKPASVRLSALASRIEGDLVSAMELAAAAMAKGDGVSLERAASRFEQIGAFLFAAESAALAQRAYLARGKPRLGRVAASRAALLLDRCPGARTPPLSDAAAVELTQRELEIARLAVEGLASREVAERLGISARTVDNHLGAVYGKLGIKGRGELPLVLGPAALRISMDGASAQET
jgi:DNA-binding CsgD family transcriptional regulator